MAPRSRTKVFSAPKGTGGRFGATWGGHQMTTGYATCTDITGPGDCAPFSVHKVTLDGGRFSQGIEGSYWSPWFKDYIADVFENLDNFPHLSVDDGGLPDTALATMAAQRSNPSRPYVDVPTMLFELKDWIPLIRDRGREILRGDFVNRAGQTNLMYQFGIAPLVGDVIKAANFHEQAQRRVQEFRRLTSERGLRRTMTLGSYSKTEVRNQVYQSVGTYMVGTFYYTTTITIRGHCRWLPDGNVLSLMAPDEMRQLANSVVRGLTIDPSTVWELVPWSWLVDWFSNIGSYLAANRNTVPATLSGVHIMRHTRTQVLMPGGSFSDVTIGNVNLIRETKTRAPSFVTPVAHFPFLSGKQVGILASLAVARR
nr:MAG: hypothetical protein 1 [Leviviridae sp.]